MTVVKSQEAFPACQILAPFLFLPYYSYLTTTYFTHFQGLEQLSLFYKVFCNHLNYAHLFSFCVTFKATEFKKTKIIRKSLSIRTSFIDSKVPDGDERNIFHLILPLSIESIIIVDTLVFKTLANGNTVLQFFGGSGLPIVLRNGL
jgi:hypothetical protein